MHSRNRGLTSLSHGARRELPWVTDAKRNQPQRGCAQSCAVGYPCRNPVGVVGKMNHIPRVGVGRQPWAGRHSPFGAAGLPESWVASPAWRWFGSSKRKRTEGKAVCALTPHPPHSKTSRKFEGRSCPRQRFGVRWLPVLRSSTAEGGAGNGADTALGINRRAGFSPLQRTNGGERRIRDGAPCGTDAEAA